jgi:hypothetical protein
MCSLTATVIIKVPPGGIIVHGRLYRATISPPLLTLLAIETPASGLMLRHVSWQVSQPNGKLLVVACSRKNTHSMSN